MDNSNKTVTMPMAEHEHMKQRVAWLEERMEELKSGAMVCGVTSMMQYGSHHYHHQSSPDVYYSSALYTKEEFDVICNDRVVYLEQQTRALERDYQTVYSQRDALQEINRKHVVSNTAKNITLFVLFAITLATIII